MAFHRTAPLFLHGLLWGLAACADGKPVDDSATSFEDDTASTEVIDSDGDGYPVETDCDDEDAAVNPAATEICDGRDNDCDEVVDDDSAADAATWYADVDGDGYGNPDAAVASCSQPAGTVADSTDCDDDSALVHPGAAEVCNGLDDDCSDATSEDGTISVDGAGAFLTLQDAIDSSLDGSTLTLCTGTYPGTVEIGHSLLLRGLGEVTLDGEYSGSIIDHTSGTLRLESLSLVNGEAELGGAILTSAGVGLEISACFFEDNWATDGGAIYLEAGSSASVADSTFNANEATGNGGAFYAGSTSVLGIFSTVFTEQAAAYGAGVFATGEAAVTIENATFSANEVVTGGGAVALFEQSVLTMSGSLVENNDSDRYSASVYANASQVDVTDTSFSNNNASSHGGAFYLFTSTLAISDSEVADNSCRWGGLAFMQGATLTAERVDVHDNVAELGGALYVYQSSSATLTDGSVTRNLAEAGGGARMWGDSTLVSNNVDWGTLTDDNYPDDVDINYAETYTDFGAGSTFICSTETGTCE